MGLGVGVGSGVGVGVAVGSGVLVGSGVGVGVAVGVGVGVTSGLTDEIRLGCEISIYAISASRTNTRISQMALSTRPTPPDFLFFFLAMVSAPSFS